VRLDGNIPSTRLTAKAKAQKQKHSTFLLGQDTKVKCDNANGIIEYKGYQLFITAKFAIGCFYKRNPNFSRPLLPIFHNDPPIMGDGIFAKN